MSLNGLIAGPGDAMDWIFEYALGPEHGNALDLSIIETARFRPLRSPPQSTRSGCTSHPCCSVTE